MCTHAPVGWSNNRLPDAASGALAADLQRYLNNAPVFARPASIAYRLSKFVRAPADRERFVKLANEYDEKIREALKSVPLSLQRDRAIR
jgi:hypothetical protein